MLQIQEIDDNGLRFIFPGNPMAVRKALSSALASLEFLRLSGQETSAIELVLAEVLNNIVEHSFAGNPDGMVDLLIIPTKSGLCFKVHDDGRSMPGNKIPIGHRPLLDSDIENLPEGGFGWFLIRDLTHDLKYTRFDRKNLLSFRIAVGNPHL